MSSIYQIAYKLGARVQVKVEDSEEWDSSNRYMGIAHGTKYRVHPDDKELLENAKELFLSLHTKVRFNDYAYYVPNNAIKLGIPVLFIYGFGVFATVNENLEVTELSDQKKATSDYRGTELHAYVAFSKKVLFDKNQEE